MHTGQRVTLEKRVDYFATKFDHPITEALYTLAMDWMSDWSGNVDAPIGCYSEVLSISSYDLRAYIVVNDAHNDALNVLVHARVPFSELEGHWILRGDSNGFIWAGEFDTHSSANAAYASLEDEYNAWDDDEFNEDESDDNV